MDMSAELETYALAVADAGPHPGVIKTNGAFVYTHCPEPGPEDDPHQGKGAPQVAHWLQGGDLRSHCDKCLGAKDSYDDVQELAEARIEYTNKLKARINWQSPKREVIHYRSHVYFTVDLKFKVIRDKVRSDGKIKWWWAALPLDQRMIPAGKLLPIRAEEFLPKNYQDFDHMHEVVHWYGLEQLPEDPAGDIVLGPLRLRRSRIIVLCEGEKDADSCNAALDIDEYFATCLSHPKPGKLRSHQVQLLAGAHVIIIPDKDVAGAAAGSHMAALVWDYAASVSILNLPDLTGKRGDKDLADWLEKHGSACELRSMLPDAVRLINKPALASEANSSLVVGPAAVIAEYKLVHWTARGGFYSDLQQREMRPTELRSNRAILAALEKTNECPRDNMGMPKRDGSRTVWRKDKEAIIGELMKLLPSEMDCKVNMNAADLLWDQINNLMHTLVGINPGSGEQRHAIGSWAMWYAGQDEWKQVQTYDIWGRNHPHGFQLAFLSTLAHQLKCCPEITHMGPKKFTQLCRKYGFCEDDNRITIPHLTFRAVRLTIAKCAELELSTVGEDAIAAKVQGIMQDTPPPTGEGYLQ